MEEERDFSEDIKINKYRLDDECEKHPSLYGYYARQQALLRSELSELEAEQKLTLAESEVDIREHWEKFSDSKMTEAGVKAQIEQHEKVQKGKNKILKISRELNIISAAVISMDHRKSMLNNLVSLQIAGFYSSPRGMAKKGIAEETSNDLRKSMNKRQEEKEEE